MENLNKGDREKTKFKLSDTGQLEYQGEIDKDVLDALLNQADFYKQKSHIIQETKLKRNNEIDAIMILFLSCMGSLLIFTTYTITSYIAGNIKNLNQPLPQSSTIIGDYDNGNV